MDPINPNSLPDSHHRGPYIEESTHRSILSQIASGGVKSRDGDGGGFRLGNRGRLTFDTSPMNGPTQPPPNELPDLEANIIVGPSTHFIVTTLARFLNSLHSVNKLWCGIFIFSEGALRGLNPKLNGTLMTLNVMMIIFATADLKVILDWITIKGSRNMMRYISVILRRNIGLLFYYILMDMGHWNIPIILTIGAQSVVLLIGPIWLDTNILGLISGLKYVSIALAELSETKYWELKIIIIVIEAISFSYYWSTIINARLGHIVKDNNDIKLAFKGYQEILLNCGICLDWGCKFIATDQIMIQQSSLLISPVSSNLDHLLLGPESTSYNYKYHSAVVKRNLILCAIYCLLKWYFQSVILIAQLLIYPLSQYYKVVKVYWLFTGLRFLSAIYIDFRLIHENPLTSQYAWMLTAWNISCLCAYIAVNIMSKTMID